MVSTGVRHSQQNVSLKCNECGGNASETHLGGSRHENAEEKEPISRITRGDTSRMLQNEQNEWRMASVVVIKTE